MRTVILMLLLTLTAQALTVEHKDGRTRFVKHGEVVLEVTEANSDTVKQKLQQKTLETAVTVEGDSAVLLLNGEKLATITQEQARRWDTTPYSLASTFAERIRKLPDGPAPLSFDPAGLTVPLNEQRTAKIKGAPSQPPDLQISDPSVVSAELTPTGLKVTALKAGDTTVTLAWANRKVTLPVKVRPWAARLPRTLRLSLTTRDPDQAFLREAVWRELLGLLHPAATLKLTVKDNKADITAEGPGLLTAAATLPIELLKADVPLVTAQHLALSNRPERISGPGIVFDRVLPQAPTRVLYHHKNNPDQPERYLEVSLTADKPGKVALIVGSVGPSEDEIHVGHIATHRWLTRAFARQGQVLEIPAGGRIVDRLRMKPGQTVSGMASLVPLEGGPFRLTIATERSDVRVPEVPNARTARGIFPGVLEASYSHLLGGKYTFIQLGDPPFLTDPETGEASPGNFGTVYRVKLLLYNPHSEPMKAHLDFSPGGGPARGVVMIDDNFLDVAMATSSQTIGLQSWTLEPHESRQVNIETLPQSGSNYPVRLVVRSEWKSAEGTPPPPTEDGPAYFP